MELSFEFEKNITRDFLLSKHSQEKYMEHYTGIHVKKGLFISPLRTDNKPTCSFFKGKDGTLLLKDFNGSFCGDFIKVVQYKFNCSYYKALIIIANDFGFIKKENIKINRPKIEYSNKILTETTVSEIRVELQEFTEKEIKWWNNFGISKNTLKLYNVYSCKNVFLNGNHFSKCTENIPLFGYYGGKRGGIEMWRIYMPTKKNYRFISNWNKSMIQGVHMLPEKGDILVITKSMKDVMLLHEFNIPAIAPNSESTFISENQLNKLKNRFENIIVLFDNDLPGIKAMKKIKNQFNLQCIWLPRSKAKDLSDFFKKYNKEETLKLINNGRKRIKT